LYGEIKITKMQIADTLQYGTSPWQPFCLSIYGVYIGATWRIRLNRSCAAAMRPYAKLLWPLVLIAI